MNNGFQQIWADIQNWWNHALRVGTYFEAVFLTLKKKKNFFLHVTAALYFIFFPLKHFVKTGVAKVT